MPPITFMPTWVAGATMPAWAEEDGVSPFAANNASTAADSLSRAGQRNPQAAMGQGLQAPARKRARRAAPTKTFEMLLAQAQDFLTPGVLPRLARRLSYDAQHLPRLQQAALWNAWALSYTQGYTKTDADDLTTAVEELGLLLPSLTDDASLDSLQALLWLAEVRGEVEPWIPKARSLVETHLATSPPELLIGFLTLCAERVLNADKEMEAWLLSTVSKLQTNPHQDVATLAEKVATRLAACVQIKLAADAVGAENMPALHHTVASNYGLRDQRAAGEQLLNAPGNLRTATDAILQLVPMPEDARAAMQALQFRLQLSAPLEQALLAALHTEPAGLVPQLTVETFINRSSPGRPVTAHLPMFASEGAMPLVLLSKQMPR